MVPVPPSFSPEHTVVLEDLVNSYWICIPSQRYPELKNWEAPQCGSRAALGRWHGVSSSKHDLLRGLKRVIPRLGVKEGTSQPPIPALRMSWSFLPGDKLNRSALSKGHCVSHLAWWLLIRSGSWGGSKQDGLWEALCSLWLLWCCSGGSLRAPHPVHLVQARTVSRLIERASGSMETVQALAMALPCSAASAPTPGLPWSSCKSVQ